MFEVLLEGERKQDLARLECETRTAAVAKQKKELRRKSKRASAPAASEELHERTRDVQANSDALQEQGLNN